MKVYEIKKQHRVEWWETDAAGIIFFANYYRMMDTAMMDFFESLPVSMPLKEYWGGQGSQGYDWVMLESGCRFFKTATFGDILEIHLWVTKQTSRTLRFACSFSKEGEEVARGFIITCSTQGLAGAQRAVLPPAEVARSIAVAPWENGKASEVAA